MEFFLVSNDFFKQLENIFLSPTLPQYSSSEKVLGVSKKLTWDVFLCCPKPLSKKWFHVIRYCPMHFLRLNVPGLCPKKKLFKYINPNYPFFNI